MDASKQQQEPPSHLSLVFRVTNASDRAVRFRLEPWGEEYNMPAGAEYSVKASGPRPDDLEIMYHADAIEVWGWVGSEFQLFSSGVELNPHSRFHVPPTPGWPVTAGEETQ